MKGFIITIVMLGCIALSLEGRAVEITLRETAAVGSEFVQMADLVTVNGCDEETAKKINLTFCGTAPGPGEERLIDISYIKMRLIQSGIDVSSVKFNGAQETSVSSAATIEINWPDDDFSPTLSGAIKEIAKPPVETLEDRLAGRIKNILVENEAVNPADIEIKIAALGRALKSAPEDSTIASIKQTGARGTATNAIFVVELLTQGRRKLRGTVIARVRLLSNVVVAARDIPVDHAITAEDIEIARIPLTGSGRDYFRSTAEVIGMKCFADIRKGAPVVSGAADRPVVIKRGDVVRVEARCEGGNTCVKTTGIARQNGKVGDTIKISNASSGIEFMARVVGDKKVDVLIGEDE